MERNTLQTRDPIQWMPWVAYYRRFPQFFGSREQASHFLQTRKSKMIALGAMVEGVKGHLVHRQKLDDLLIGLLAKAGADLPCDVDDPLDGFSTEALRAALVRRGEVVA